MLNFQFGYFINEYSSLKYSFWHSSLVLSFFQLFRLHTLYRVFSYLRYHNNSRNHCWCLKKNKVHLVLLFCFLWWKFSTQSDFLVKQLMHKIYLLLLSILHGCYLTTGTLFFFFHFFMFCRCSLLSLRGTVLGSCYLNLC